MPGVIAGHGFTIDSLIVCRTETRNLTYICIVISGQDGVVEKARQWLEDVVCSLLSSPYSSQPSPSVGAGIGGARLDGDTYGLAQPTRQSVHSRARLRRGPVGRRVFSQAAAPHHPPS